MGVSKPERHRWCCAHHHHRKCHRSMPTMCGGGALFTCADEKRKLRAQSGWCSVDISDRGGGPRRGPKSKNPSLAPSSAPKVAFTKVGRSTGHGRCQQCVARTEAVGPRCWKKHNKQTKARDGTLWLKTKFMRALAPLWFMQVRATFDRVATGWQSGHGKQHVAIVVQAISQTVHCSRMCRGFVRKLCSQSGWSTSVLTSGPQSRKRSALARTKVLLVSERRVAILAHAFCVVRSCSFACAVRQRQRIYLAIPSRAKLA